MSVDTATVKKVASLARIAISDADAERLAPELNNILGWIEQLGEVDTSGVAPMTAVIPNQLRLRDDVVTDGNDYGYRNKIEFSWYSELDEKTGLDSLDLAFYKRGSRGKVIVEGSTLANELSDAGHNIAAAGQQWRQADKPLPVLWSRPSSPLGTAAASG